LLGAVDESKMEKEDIKTKMNEASKSFHEVLYRLNKVIDKGSNLPTLLPEIPQQITVFQGVPTVLRIELVDKNAPLNIKFKNVGG
jgi:uncharacterized protein YccT (UPF0319 family)